MLLQFSKYKFISQESLLMQIKVLLGAIEQIFELEQTGLIWKLSYPDIRITNM
jgi:hypothetical protein